MNKIVLTLCLTICLTSLGYGQTGAIGPDGKQISVDLANACSDPPNIFLVVEKPAEFKEGRKALISALNEQVTLSKKAKGNVILMFLINCRGEASGFIVPKADDMAIAKDVIAALTKIQGWQAASQRKNSVDSHKMISLGYKKGRFL